MKTITASLFGLTSLLNCHGALAQRDTEEGIAPAVEISAFRLPVLETEATQGVTVISSRTIQARNATSVAEILQMVPGVQVDRMGGPGGLSSIYIRGNDLEHTLVLIDGVRMNDPLLSRPGYDLSALDPNAIERIEVIRGAGSAVFGADAIGGVVNIVTRRDVKEPLKFTAGAGVGGKGYANGTARLAGAVDRISYSGGVAKLQDGRDSDGGEIDLTTLDGNLSLQWAPGSEIKLFGRHNHRESTGFPAQSGGIRLATVRTLEQRESDENALGAAFSYGAGDAWQVNAQLSRYSREEDIDAPGIPDLSGFFDVVPATRSTTELTRDVMLLSGLARLPMSTDLTVGYERQREDGDSRSTLQGLPAGDFSRDRTTNSWFAAVKSRPLESLVLMLDLRHDRVTGLDSEWSPGIGARYELARTGTAVKARYSEGFRPPSFYALSSPLVGNASLVPETSRSLEIGAEQRLVSNLQVGGALYKTRTRNLIDFQSGAIGPLGFGQMVNRDEVESKGFELYINAQPVPEIEVSAQYTYVSSDIKNSTDELQNRPKHRGSLGVNYRLDEASRISLNVVHVGRSFDESFATNSQTTVNSHTRTDLGYTYRWRQFSMSATVENLFDKRYEEFIGFTDPGRRFRLNVSASF